jgi:toxin CptA
MSIAVTASIKPSRILLTMVGLACVCVAFVAGMVAFGTGHLSYPLRWLLAGMLLLASITALLRFFLGRKTFQLDISGIGQIRLQEMNVVGSAAAQGDRQDENPAAKVACTAQLMADSTLGPHLLLLRLKIPGKRVLTVPVLQDSVTEEEFKALGVACRWIAARGALVENERTPHQ